MKNMKKCPKHGIYPARFDSCPSCNPNVKSAPTKRLTTEEHIARMTDTEVKFIFQSSWWEQGNEKARRLCLQEYDKRIGLENWPIHISKAVK